VIAVIEDIHWADPAMLDLLDEIAERAEGPTLFLCPSRTTLLDHRPTWGGGRRNVSSIALEPLSDEDADRLVSLLLAIDDLPPSTHRLILERAEGNPFFLEEIVRQLIDQRQIVFEDERWRAAASIVDVEIPDTVQGVLAARIDLLETPDKRTLQLAAVVGRVFWPAPVGLLLNGDRERLGEILDRLEGRDLVRSRAASTVAGEQEFVFKHVLTRDVAYDTLPRRDRARAHATVADWIDSTAPGRSEFLELLAYHLDAAYQGERDDPRGDHELVAKLRARAFEATLAAAEDAHRRYAVTKALRLAERARALADTPLEQALAYEQTGLTALSDYRGDMVWDMFREAVAIRTASLPDDPTAIARACAHAVESPTRWPGSMTDIPPEDAVDGLIRLGFDRIGEGDSLERVRLLTARAFAPFAYAGVRGTSDEELEASRRDGIEAAAMAERLGRPDLASAALDGATSTGVIMGHYARDVELVERRLALLRATDDPWEQGDAHAMASWAWGSIGDFGRAVAYALEGRARATDAGAEGIVIHLWNWQAYAEFWLGGFDAVLEALDSAEALLGDRKDDPPYFTQNLYGTAALVASIRGSDELRARLTPIVERMSLSRAGGTGAVGAAAWRAWIAAREGAHDEAASYLTLARVDTRGHWPILIPAWAVALVEGDRWDEVPGFLAEYRPWVESSELRGLPPTLDRLEGQAALRTGDTARAIELLERAADGFGAIAAAWERACTDLVLADALHRAGRVDEARARLDAAAEVCARLGSLLEIERAGVLAARLGEP